MIRAVIFDFDGLILDTETPVYEAWRATFVDHGAEPITRARWIAQIELADGEALDPLAELRAQVGDVDPDTINRRRRAHRDHLLAAEDVRPGVGAWGLSG